MKTKIISTLVFVGQLAIAQEVKKEIGAFSKLEIAAPTTVFLKVSNAPYISYDAKDSAGALDWSVNEGKLIIRQKKNGDMPDKITLGYNSLTDIEVGGAATLKTTETLSANNLGLTVNGAGKCKMDMNASTLSATVGGAGSCTLSGTVNKLDAIVSGAASFKAEGLTVQNADVTTSGAATARVNVKEKLSGNASGASSLKFTGDPKEVRINQSGAANVKSTDNAKAMATSDSTGRPNGDRDSVKRYSINGRYEIVIHDKSSTDTTKSKGRKIEAKGLRKKNWAGVDLFENGYLTADNNITLPASMDAMSLNYGGRNLGWNLNLFEKDFRFAAGKLQLVTGLGFSFNYYALKNKTTLNADSSYTGNVATTGVDFKKNKLRESFVTVPLLLELNTSRRESRNFHIAAGVIGGLKLGSSTKQVFTSIADNHTYKTVRRDDYNLFPFKLDATVRVGYGKFTLFGTYSLTPLFEYGKGPELYPFTVGVQIIPF